MCSLTILAPPLLCSLWGNWIGDEGVTKLAAVLKETKISELKYATTSNRPPSVRFCVSAR